MLAERVYGIVRVVGGGEGTLGTIRETFGKYKYKMLSADSWPEDLLGGQVTLMRWEIITF